MLYRRMVETQSVCLRRLGKDRAGEVCFGRWLRNKKVTRQELMAVGCDRTGLLATGLHVLAIHDTSEIDYQRHADRVSGLGTVGNGKDVGLFIYPLLAVDAASGACLGLAHQHQWLRMEKAGKRKQLPIEEKESYRWLEVAQAGKRCLSQAAMVTIIADRESDIYEEWDRIPDDKTHLLTRACQNRKLANGEMLFESLAQQPVVGCYALDVVGRAGERTVHRAQMEIRYNEVEIQRPAHCKDKTAKPSIKLFAIDVREQDVFDHNAIDVLKTIQPQVEGRTVQQKNPHSQGTLAWAAWLIARLGGWKGYASEAKPGPITMLRGQQRFSAMHEGWKLAKMCA